MCVCVSVVHIQGLPCKVPAVQALDTKRGGRRIRGKRGRGGKGKKKKKVESDTDYSCSSLSDDSSEDEWEPWKEETKKRPKGRGTHVHNMITVLYMPLS